jgi:hypothetical protein
MWIERRLYWIMPLPTESGDRQFHISSHVLVQQYCLQPYLLFEVRIPNSSYFLSSHPILFRLLSRHHHLHRIPLHLPFRVNLPHLPSLFLFRHNLQLIPSNLLVHHHLIQFRQFVLVLVSGKACQHPCRNHFSLVKNHHPQCT